MNGRLGQRGAGSDRGRPWGFVLVLAAIVVVAIMYTVTIHALTQAQRTPETVFGAMAASFAVIGTLVGTYFGIKAGLDGQDKVRDTPDNASGERGASPRSGAKDDGDPRSGGQATQDRQNGAREPVVIKGGDSDDKQGWHGGSV